MLRKKKNLLPLVFSFYIYTYMYISKPGVISSKFSPTWLHLFNLLAQPTRTVGGGDYRTQKFFRLFFFSFLRNKRFNKTFRNGNVTKRLFRGENLNVEFSC